MTGWIRPEARAALWRWREVAAGAAAFALGLWWAATGLGILRWVGLVLALAAALLVWAALTRLRRPGAGTGPGLVEVDERRITFLSSRGGGSVSVDALAEVEIARTGHGAFWVLTEGDGTTLSLPSDATGAAQIFDALAALAGFDEAAALAALRGSGPGRVTLWRDPAAPAPARLH